MSTPTATVDSHDIIPRCDVCNAIDETVEWCGGCGCCVEHCQNEADCDKYTVMRETGVAPEQQGGSPATATAATECDECGQSMTVDANEVTNHVSSDGDIDYDADADHVARNSHLA